MSAIELNLDGLVGPTHLFGGLSPGNLASQRHGGMESNPRAAALQGLAKMKLLADLGVEQAVLPPAPRPDPALLRALGYDGADPAVLERAGREAPDLLAAASSASSMWAANAATVCPSADAGDGKAHFSAANLVGELHRSIEARSTTDLLRRIFPHPDHFVHHGPLPATAPLRDEGAANHTRLCRRHGEPGIHLFVYGEGEVAGQAAPARYPARQAEAASRAVARRHRIDPDRLVFARQHPGAIDAGVFHNDVIMTGDTDTVLCHEQAWAEQDRVLGELGERFKRCCGRSLRVFIVTTDELTVAEAVDSYLFNSQLLHTPDDRTLLLCPLQCREMDRARAVTERLVADGAADEALHVDLRQSMSNGGGPACLRLRVVLTQRELAVLHRGVRLTCALYEELTGWVERHYRDRLRAVDLADPALLEESREAMRELAGILDLEDLYRGDNGTMGP